MKITSKYFRNLINPKKYEATAMEEMKNFSLGD
jgi:hypothetical protein